MGGRQLSTEENRELTEKIFVVTGISKKLFATI